MTLLQWLSTHGMELLQGVGIIAGLGFTTASFLKDDASRRVSNLLSITDAHRKIWSEIYQRPELSRVLKRLVDLKSSPVTDEEALFVTFLLLHLGTAYRAIQEGMFVTGQALDRDIHWFLNLPIPGQVWQEAKSYLEPDFVAFVDLLRSKATDSDQRKTQP